MPVRKKLLLAMLIPAVLLGAVGAMGVYSLRRLEQAAGRILSDNYHSIQQTRRMEHALWQLESYEIAGGPATDASPDEIAATFTAALHACETNITESGERVVLERIRREWETVRADVRHTTGDPLAPASRMRRRAAGALYDDMEVLTTLNEGAMIEYEHQTRRVAQVMLGAVAATALAAIVALLFFALASARRIADPITQVADRLHAALNPPPPGDIVAGTHELDEIVRLRDELDALLERLGHYENEQQQRLSHLQGRLAFVMNEVREGLVLLDGGHQILAMNRVARRLLGSDAVAGARLDDLAPPQSVRRALGPFLSGSFDREHDLEELRFDLDGATRVYRPRVLAVASGDGTPEGYLLLFWDVTEQHRFEEGRRRFISMLSHQLKTPMTALSMSVNLLREKLRDVSPTHSELLAIAAENCNSLAALVSDLIEAARDITPDLAIVPKRIDLLRLLRTALRPLVPQAQDKGIELVVPASDGTVWASVDPVKFPWVVTNIAGNALRYTERGGRIAVGVTQGGEGIEVTITDTGAGMPPEDVARIFAPYVSLDDEPPPGTHGLGLTIAREIVEAHDGTIAAASAPGKGTRFCIRLPGHSELSS